MTFRTSLAPSMVKVLVITVSWTLINTLVYVSTYLLIGDLIQLGTLSGTYAFWPDFAGNAVASAFLGLVGGSLLVFKLNAGYKHKTFLSGIITSVALFVVIFVSAAVVILFAMPFVLYSVTDGVGSAFQAAWLNVRINFYTPSFLTSIVEWGVVVSGTQFMLQVNDKFGPGVLWKLLTGKYYHPRDEERVFMFLDLKSSTEIAERIGHHRFFELLKELFQDITRPVLDSRGDIYQYAGDEVVITWPVPRGFEDANCVQCFFRIDRTIAHRQSDYLERFGVAPQFKAGLHVGAATVGEIGVLKKDIVYSGDVLNTTARIQEECNRHDVRLLVSSQLLQRLSVKDGFDVHPIGEIRLRGKAEGLALSEVRAN